MTSTVTAEPRNGLDRYFRISERGSTVSREIRGGLATFFTMAYIVVLNPLIIGTVPDKTGAVLGIPKVAAATALVAGHPAAHHSTARAARLRRGSATTGGLANEAMAAGIGHGRHLYSLVSVDRSEDPDSTHRRTTELTRGPRLGRPGTYQGTKANLS